MFVQQIHVLRCLLLGGLAVGIALVPAQSRAMDCSRAKTRMEKAICATPDLAQKDRELNEAYRATLQTQTAERKSQLIKHQRAWLKEVDRVCEGDKDCLTKNIEDQKKFFTRWSATKDGSLTYQMITMKAIPDGNSYWQTNYPIFVGTDSSEKSELPLKLNEWVKEMRKHAGGNEPNCKGGEGFEFLKMNDAVTVGTYSSGYYCEGAAHPWSNYADFFIDNETTQDPDFWGLLSEDKQDEVRRIIVSAAEKNIPEGDDCKDAFTYDFLKLESIVFRYKDEKVIELDPSFSHVRTSCLGMANATIAIPDLLNLYPDDVKPKVEKVLKGLQQ